MKHKQCKKHQKLMLLFCLIPLLLLAFLPRMGFDLGPLAKYAPFAMILICPLIHFVMMASMFKSNKQ